MKDDIDGDLARALGVATIEVIRADVYHEELIINDVLHWRGAPDAEFVAYTPEDLTARFVWALRRSNPARSAALEHGRVDDRSAS